MHHEKGSLQEGSSPLVADGKVPFPRQAFLWSMNTEISL